MMMIKTNDNYERGTIVCAIIKHTGRSFCSFYFGLGKFYYRNHVSEIKKIPKVIHFVFIFTHKRISHVLDTILLKGKSRVKVTQFDCKSGAAAGPIGAQIPIVFMVSVLNT